MLHGVGFTGMPLPSCVRVYSSRSRIKEGLRLGHRLFVVHAGDDWRRDLAPAQQAAASVEPPAEPEEYPDEVIAESRVVAIRPHSATLLVTRATLPVSVGDRAQLRSGY